jgi:hypothetical protein
MDTPICANDAADIPIRTSMKNKLRIENNLRILFPSAPSAVVFPFWDRKYGCEEVRRVEPRLSHRYLCHVTSVSAIPFFLHIHQYSAPRHCGAHRWTRDFPHDYSAIGMMSSRRAPPSEPTLAWRSLQTLLGLPFVFEEVFKISRGDARTWDIRCWT